MIAKPNFRSPFLEAIPGSGKTESWGSLDLYWQRIMVSMVDAINVQSNQITALESKVAALEQYNTLHP